VDNKQKNKCLLSCCFRLQFISILYTVSIQSSFFLFKS